jgi:formate C-acetyltransferase
LSLSRPPGRRAENCALVTISTWGQHIQFNVTNTAVLRAQRHPGAPDLVVRVAGFSVLFTAIDPVLQEDIIERTEHRV